MPNESIEGADKINKNDEVAPSASDKKRSFLRTSALTILATAFGTALILIAAAFFLPGLNSLKIQLFQATVEIDNRDDAFEVLEGMKADRNSRKLLENWLDSEGYISLNGSQEEQLAEEEREKRAVEQASKFRSLVPAEIIEFQLTPDEIEERIRSFEEKTGKTTLAGQLRILAREGAPPFNVIGVKAVASRPGYSLDYPPGGTVYIRQDAEFAKYFSDGAMVEIANSQASPPKVIIAKVRKRNIASVTDVHLRPRQWRCLELQSIADPTFGTSSIVLRPKNTTTAADSGAARPLPGAVNENFLSANTSECPI